MNDAGYATTQDAAPAVIPPAFQPIYHKHSVAIELDYKGIDLMVMGQYVEADKSFDGASVVLGDVDITELLAQNIYDEIIERATALEAEDASSGYYRD